MRSVLVRRFEISDQLTHLFNALFWAVLAATGILIGSASRANGEPTHFSIGVHFAFGFALAILLSAYILGAKSRFQRMLFEIFRTDRPFLAWLKCLGGYPSKILNRPQKSSSVPPQGRYTAGQRIAYGALIFLNILLLTSGFALFALHQPQEVQSSAYRLALCVHSGAFGLACLLPATHIPMAFLSRPRSKPCCCLWEEFFWQNKKHVALGVKEDLEAERNAVAIRTKHNHTILREKRLK